MTSPGLGPSCPTLGAPGPATPAHGVPRQRDPHSFTAYVRTRRPVLLRTARSLTSDPRDAEDLLQTALTRTYLSWDRIRDRGALDGYVRRTLINTRTSLWRKRRIDEYACAELPESAHGRTPDVAEAQALRDAMWRAVASLPDRQRAMVVLRYYEDLTEVETARIMGVATGTVKSAVSRALTKLRDDPQLAAVTRESAGGEPAADAAAEPAAA